jgi:modification methylase
MYANSTGWQGSVVRFPPAPRSKHRCPFPLKLASFLLGQTKAKSVIDPFIGQGTTAIAARELGMSWAGIDLDISLAQSLLPEAIAA